MSPWHQFELVWHFYLVDDPNRIAVVVEPDSPEGFDIDVHKLFQSGPWPLARMVQNTGVREQNPGVRIQNPGARIQNPGVRSREFRSQGPGLAFATFNCPKISPPEAC